MTELNYEFTLDYCFFFYLHYSYQKKNEQIYYIYKETK